ncbi:unnamed protein product [Spodoptera exigua]|nr:unnamed protein product [Spodoptera exigua]
MGLRSEILIHPPRGGKHVTGGTIRGMVKFHLDKDTDFKKISIALIQKGHVQWYEFATKSSVNPRRTVGNRYVYEGREEVTLTKVYFLNKEIDEKCDTSTLKAGSYEHQFEIELPEEVPASISTDIGEINYSIVLKFKKPSVFSFNKVFRTPVTIYPRLDPTIPDQPVTVSLEKSLFKLFSSKKHEIKLKAELDRGYLIPGGEGKISFSVINNSDVIFSVKTELVSKTKYRDRFMVEKIVRDNPKIERKVIRACTVETPSIPERSVSSDMYNIIPVTTDLCTVRHSELISREFKLKVTLNLPMPHKNSCVDIPVFIGEQPHLPNELEAGFGEPMEAPPSYWEVMTEEMSK